MAIPMNVSAGKKQKSITRVGQMERPLGVTAPWPLLSHHWVPVTPNASVISFSWVLRAPVSTILILYLLVLLSYRLPEGLSDSAP